MASTSAPNRITVNSAVVPQPTLSIALAGPDVVLAWPPNFTGYALQQNPDLHPAHWTSYAGTVTTSGTNQITTVIAPAGNLFFRLSNP